MRIIPALIALSVIAAPAAAFPAVGDKAPAVAGTDITGKTRTLKQVAGRKGTVLMFFRSASWCPFCKAQLIAMNDKAADGLAQRGYALVGLSYDSFEVLAKFAAERKVNWPLLSDPQSKVIDGWQLRDPAYPLGNKAYGVPLASVYVIDRKGIIRARLMEANYRVRPQPEAVLAAVDALGQ
ncbi:peroxiredoxin family protein [Sandarakinorhabdus sp. AAP62]|uniref:peroxiredoxin family protein n=1 Tax=Sandarakinorhabdus sp. AAP62 TaxID=1248916 RepID=UPI000305B728|nr:peroxiredoxin family protein [Sandarakinorhabdus sp. AAP62]